MKAKDAHRASTLVSALAAIDKFTAHAQQAETDWYGQLHIGKFGEQSSLNTPMMRGLVLLDPKTSELVGNSIRKIIEDELTFLGVEI